jgi:hypothetical protein
VEFVNPGLVKIGDTTQLEHLFILLRKCERICMERDLFIVGNDAVSPRIKKCSPPCLVSVSLLTTPRASSLK